MAFVEWEESYSVNNIKIDAHHKKLFELVSNLYDKVFECEDAKAKQLLIGKTLAELVDYTYYHFAQEEELLFKHEYPDYTTHKKQHEHFKSHLLQLTHEYEAGTLILSLPILIFLRDWINLHIINSDKKYEAYFESKNIK